MSTVRDYDFIIMGGDGEMKHIRAENFVDAQYACGLPLDSIRSVVKIGPKVVQFLITTPEHCYRKWARIPLDHDGAPGKLLDNALATLYKRYPGAHVEDVK